MKKTVKIVNILVLLICLGWLIYIYPKLPDIIPTHWGISGEIDGYGSKKTVFFLYGTMVFCNIFFDVARKIDPKSKNYDRFESAFEIFKLIFTLFMAGLIVITTSVTFKPSLNVSSFLTIGVGVMFAVIGNYMPTFKHNYTMGIKTPWTLASETVWNKTHRMAGPIWVVGGIALAASGIFLKPSRTSAVMFALLAVLVVIPMVYSYFVFKKEESAHDNSSDIEK